MFQFFKIFTKHTVKTRREKCCLLGSCNVFAASKTFVGSTTARASFYVTVILNVTIFHGNFFGTALLRKK